MKKIFLGLALICPGFYLEAITYQRVLGSICAQFLGSEDVSSNYKKLAHQALADAGVKNPHNVLVKQMNNIGSSIVQIPLASFNMFGLWFDQEYLNQAPGHAQIFDIYHEAAHYALFHREKLTAVLLPTVGLLGYLSPKIVRHGAHLSGISSLENKYFVIGATVVLFSSLAATLNELCLRPRCKFEEQEADIKAVEILSSVGKSDIVGRYIYDLQQMNVSNEMEAWHSTVSERILYMENALSSCKK